MGGLVGSVVGEGCGDGVNVGVQVGGRVTVGVMVAVAVGEGPVAGEDGFAERIERMTVIAITHKTTALASARAATMSHFFRDISASFSLLPGATGCFLGLTRYNFDMEREIIERLLALNHKFYTDFAETFANSRSVSDPALTAILPYLPQRARVLDIGCGNGRLALLLNRERLGTTYVGVDEIPALIAVARDQAGQLDNTATTFCIADVTDPDWIGLIPQESYDCAVVLAVLHHIPSFDLRVRILRDVYELLKPGGYVILSTWRFLSSARIRRKIVDWSEVDIAEDWLDAGDYLLDWKRGGRGLRYCHMVDADEVQRLAEESGFRVRETFRAGGREGNLSLFAILDRRR